MSLDYLQLAHWRKNHPAWRLLLADHAPLIAYFLSHAFLENNDRVLSQEDLSSRLEDFIFQLQDIDPEQQFPKNSIEYLDEWAHLDKGWLRKFYPPGNDEAHYDLTPACEKALRWLMDLNEQHFVGTESRLLMIFELLRQIVHGSETDPKIRIAELQEQKKNIEQQIQALKNGQIDILNESAVKDRFMQFQSCAKALLGDFRNVEHNFRTLDRNVREQIAAWTGYKGDLLQHIFGERDAITDTDQGRSFQAFWDFLMSPNSQEELTQLLDKTYAMDSLQELSRDKSLKRIHYDWLEAGEFTQRTIARLSQQLRRFLDDQAYLENKRIVKLLDQINSKAIQFKQDPPRQPDIMTLNKPQIAIQLPMERPLFTPPLEQNLQSLIPQDETIVDINLSALFNQRFVDKKRLMDNIRQRLQKHAQTTLAQIIDHYPLQEGLAELVTYIVIAAGHPCTLFNTDITDSVQWQDSLGTLRKATIPQIIFNRTRQEML